MAGKHHRGAAPSKSTIAALLNKQCQASTIAALPPAKALSQRFWFYFGMAKALSQHFCVPTVPLDAACKSPTPMTVHPSLEQVETLSQRFCLLMLCHPGRSTIAALLPAHAMLEMSNCCSHGAFAPVLQRASTIAAPALSAFQRATLSQRCSQVDKRSTIAALLSSVYWKIWIVWAKKIS